MEKGSNCSDSDSDIAEPPSKKAYRELIQPSTMKNSKNWENEFSWQVYDEDINGAFCRVCKQTTAECATQHTGGVLVTKLFQNWKKATERMKAHERSSRHTQASQAMLDISKHDSVVQQLQRVRMQEREKNSAAMKSLVRCTHFLTRHHIAHSTNFTQLVDLVVSCGARELQVFIKNASRNAVDTSQGAVVDFIEALGTWVEESILKRLQKASVFSVMADECTNIMTVEELSVFCRWEEDGTPVECFLDIVPLKKADAESKYLALVKCIKDIFRLAIL